MKKIKLFFMAMAMLVSALAYGQNLTVTGVVKDSSTGEGVPFASIQLKGTMTGVSTDGDGYYSLTVPADGVLIFSSVGYISQEIAVSGKAKHDVLLSPDTEALEETIVVAFGTATKESFTGSATVVKSSDIAKVQSSDATRALEGVVAGVQMTTSSGSLGSSPSIIIRGISSISAGSAPLYIVDGVPFSGDMNNLNSADIESMTVLKDAASNALYGARGANGVIMITTKKAKAGDAVVNFESKIGLNTKALQHYDYIKDPATYYETHYNALYNYYVDKQGLSHLEANAKAAKNVTGPSVDGGLGYLIYTVPEGEAFIGTNGKLNPNASYGRIVNYEGEDYLLQGDDWMAETYKQSIRQEYNLNVSGTSGKAQFFGSFGYLNNKGIVDGADMYRYTARLKSDYQAKKWLNVGMNMGYTKFNWNNGNSDEGSSGSSGNMFAFAANVAPIYPVFIRDGKGNILRDKNGLLRYDYGNGANAGYERPYQPNSNALQLATLDLNNSEGNAFTGNGHVDVTFLKDFAFTVNAGFGVDETRSRSVNNMYYGQFAPTGGTIQVGHSRSYYFNFQQLLNWNKSFGAHNMSVLLGHESYLSQSFSVSGYKTNLFSMDNTELNGAVVDGQGAASSRSEYNNEGYLARAQYDYDEKLFLSASYRRDASSRFHPDHRWGNFWSFGAGWLINHEPWFNASWVDMLKVKASVGSQGNDSIGNYLYTDLYSISNNEGQIAIAFGSKGNKEITWETNTNMNAGVDFDLFKGRISGTLEYFYRKTSDMLFFFTVPASLGYSGYYDNIGDMRNAGVELALNGVIFNKKNFYWDVNANATHYTNKITMLPEERKTREIEGYKGYASGNKFVAEGLPLNTFLMKKYAGVNKENGLPMWYADTYELNEKGEKVLDANGNPIVTGRETTTEYSEATEYLCDNPTPLLYGGFGTSLRFYGFDVAAQFTYSIGGLTYDSGYAALVGAPTTSLGSNVHVDVLNAWSETNKDSDMPRYQYLDQNINATSDRFLVDASYLNIQNVQIGYTIPQHVTQKFNVSKIRVSASCDNVFYWSRRKGLDPRYSFTGATNYANNSPVRTISGGINITF